MPIINILQVDNFENNSNQVPCGRDRYAVDLSTLNAGAIG
jgi:hypothetical protein